MLEFRCSISDILSDHSWIILLVGASICFGVATHYMGEGHKLRHIPTTVSTTPIAVFFETWLYLFRSNELINDNLQKWPNKMFRIPVLSHWVIVASAKEVTSEVIRAPEANFSAFMAFDEVKYTVGPDLIRNPHLHYSILNNQLRRSLPNLVPQAYVEIVDAFTKHIPLTDDWSTVKVSTIVPYVVSQASNCIFVGHPLCRNREFINLMTQYSYKVFIMSFVLRCIPTFFRPLVNYVASNIPKQKCRALKLLGPLFDTRREERKKIDVLERPLDMVTWLMDTALTTDTNEALIERLLAINFAAIHPISTAFLHAIYYLAMFPEFAELLRDEVDVVIQQQGWTKAGLDSMKRVDSFIKESQRMNPPAIAGMERLVLQDHIFSDGTFVPRGSTVAVNIHRPHFDATVYEDPQTFDPLRFVKMQETSGRAFDIITTADDFLAFGHGRHACPGRYLASCELKMMLAYVTAHYDIELAHGGSRPPDQWMMTWCLPNQSAELLFRKRKGKGLNTFPEASKPS